MANLGSPGDPSLSPVAWSVTGQYLAAAVEKMVNIWQVNGEAFKTTSAPNGPPSLSHEGIIPPIWHWTPNAKTILSGLRNFLLFYF